MLFLPVLFLFIFGLVIGSFLNVVIYRSLYGESPLEGRSHCEHCGKMIAWYDNIPLLSFIILGAKCRNCRKPISWTHPTVELMTGILFVWWYLGGFFFWQFFQLTAQPFNIIQPLFWLLVGIFLLIILVTDVLSYIIPDYAVGSLFILSLIYRLGLVSFGIMQVRDFLMMLLGVVIITGFFFGLWLLTKGKGMGFGDVKFTVPMGLLLGWPDMFVGVMMAFILGAAVGIVAMIVGKKKLKSQIPFGPFLVIGTAIGLVWGDQILKWYLGML